MDKTRIKQGIFYGAGTGFILAIIGLASLLRVTTETYDRFVIPKGNLTDVVISVLIFITMGAIIGGFIGHFIKNSK